MKNMRQGIIEEVKSQGRGSGVSGRGICICKKHASDARK